MTDDAEGSGGRRTGDSFPHTRWTLIRRLRSPEAEEQERKEALEELCRSYWYPLYATLRRMGEGPEEAADLTQDFFLHVLETDFFTTAEQGKGSLRAYLTHALKMQRYKHWRHDQARKRGGGTIFESLDLRAAEKRYDREPADSAPTPEQAFDHAWARALLKAALGRLRAEMTAAGKAEEHKVLEPFLNGERNVPYEEVARHLGTTESNIKVKVKRLREKFSHLVRMEVTKTLLHASEQQVAEELLHLQQALRGG